MITTLAAGELEERENALKNNIVVATSVHEAGHVVMGRQHRVSFPVVLSALIQKGDKVDLAEHAGSEISVRGLTRTAISDMSFAGCCGELVFYDDSKLHPDPHFFDARRAANDMRSFVRLLGKNPVTASLLDERLQSGGQIAEDTVVALFKQYGMQTYKTMQRHRTDLIDVAQQLFNFWAEHKFQKCVWAPTEDRQ